LEAVLVHRVLSFFFPEKLARQVPNAKPVVNELEVKNQKATSSK